MSNMIPLPPRSGFLATSGRRAMAAEMVDTAGSAITDGVFVAEALDLLSGVLLRLAGVDDAAARSVLAALWDAR